MAKSGSQSGAGGLKPASSTAWIFIVAVLLIVLAAAVLYLM
jgi:hypothetical protein